jgi:hypothetical protein
MDKKLPNESLVDDSTLTMAAKAVGSIDLAPVITTSGG